MHNVFLFLRRFSVLIAFFILQIISLYFLFSYNKYHRARGLGMAGEITSYFNGKYKLVNDFFKMKEENKRIHAMNDSLMNLLNRNFISVDSTGIVRTDSARIDTAGKTRHFFWRNAQVLYATVSSDKNYLQINKGSASGIKEDMGVLSSNGGIVGKVVNVGTNFSQVMTLLNVINKLSVQMKRTGTSGMLSWDGKTPTELTLNGIPKTDSIKRGDTVLTGNYSLSYPSEQLVGTVVRVLKDGATNFLILKIKPTASFGSLQHVFVVENLNLNEQKALDNETRKIIDKSQSPK